jgi:hypothetical protein
MKNLFKNQTFRKVVVFGSALTCGIANAAIDVSGVVTELKDTLTPIGLVGGAVLIVVVSVKAFKYIKSAI